MRLALSIVLWLQLVQAPGVDPARAELEQAQALVAELAPRVERLRGLKFKRPVSVKVVSPEEARSYFAERVRKLWPEAKLRADEAAYQQLGLLPDAGPLLPMLLDLLQEQARGYYDPASDSFCVVRGVSADAQSLVFAHELTHALDDQYYDLERLSEAAQDDDDGTALAAVVEGSGTLVMTAFMVEELRAGRLDAKALGQLASNEEQSAARLRLTPPFLQRSLLAPYALGLPFLLRGDLRAVAAPAVVPADLSRAFERPPRSTEQILYPEKYWGAPDVPLHPQLPDLAPLLGPGFERHPPGHLGELALGCLAGLELPDLQSPRAMQARGWTSDALRGWKGDAFEHYASPKGGLTVLLTAWDDPQSARRFEVALRPFGGRFAYREGSHVLLVGGADHRRAAAIRQLVRRSLDRAGVAPGVAPSARASRGSPPLSKTDVAARQVLSVAFHDWSLPGPGFASNPASRGASVQPCSRAHSGSSASRRARQGVSSK